MLADRATPTPVSLGSLSDSFSILYAGGPENLLVRSFLRAKKLPFRKLEDAGIYSLGDAFARVHELEDIPGVGPKTLAVLAEALDKYRAACSVRHWPRREGLAASFARSLYKPDPPLLSRIQKAPRIQGLDAWLTTKG